MKKDFRTIFIDFDGTICPNKGNNTYPDSYPAPTEDCKKTIQALKDAGHKIVIYSVRSNPNETHRFDGNTKMLEYLALHSIPYDDIITTKPHFSVVIDDKGLGCPMDDNKNVKWDDVRSLLEKKNYLPSEPQEALIDLIMNPKFRTFYVPEVTPDP